MVIRTEVCNFSEQKIYPGKGTKIMTKDGNLLVASSSKSLSYLKRKLKAQTFRWTIVWRRMNKKFKADKTQKKRKRKAVKQIKGIAGMAKEEIEKKMNQSPEELAVIREKIQLELKQKIKAKQAAAKKTKKK